MHFFLQPCKHFFNHCIMKMITTLPQRSSRQIKQKRTPISTPFFLGTKASALISIKTLCASYHLTRETVTKMTSFSPRAVANWASGKKPSPSAQKKLTELDRLFKALCGLTNPKSLPSWLQTANPAFEGSTPLQVIERGEIDRLWKMIWQLESGNVG